MLVNAREIKRVPGRGSTELAEVKTDVKDGEWIAQLPACGLLRRSFVPPLPQRELRDLTRTRTSLLQDRSRSANRLQKVLG